MKNIINCFVDVVGAKAKRKMHGIVDVVSSKNDFSVILNLSENKKISYPFNGAENLYLPQATKGIIQEDDESGNVIPIEGVTVSFIKDLYVIDKMPTSYSGNEIIIDSCITNINGEYVVFVEPGIYTIRIDDGKNTRYFYNEKIDSGLSNQFYYTIDGALIKSRYNDVAILNGIAEKFVSGKLIDEHGEPLPEAEIIISQDDDIVTYIKTDDEGCYGFLLGNGIYDIRIRGYKQPVKILRGFQFNDNDGFVISLQNQSSIFREVNWLTFV